MIEDFFAWMLVLFLYSPLIALVIILLCRAWRKGGE